MFSFAVSLKSPGVNEGSRLTQRFHVQTCEVKGIRWEIDLKYVCMLYIYIDAVDAAASWKCRSSILTLGVQRPLNKWPFRKDHYFSRDLQSTIPGDYYFNGL